MGIRQPNAPQSKPKLTIRFLFVNKFCIQSMSASLFVIAFLIDLFEVLSNSFSCH